MLKAGSPDPAARSNTTESRFSAASAIRASVMALFQFADAATHRLLTRARAAESHVLWLVIVWSLKVNEHLIMALSALR